ncbi:hypothetical protein [Microbacterium sp. P5_E9]
MRFDDDELGALLRRLDPALTPEDTPLTVAQVVLRDRITGAVAPAPARRRSPLLWWSAVIPALATVVVALVVVFSLVSVPRAVALTPTPVTFTDTGQTAKDVLALAQHALVSDGSPADPQRESTATGWYLQIDEHQGETTVAISPQVTTLRWEPDQSGHVTVVAGTPYWADGSDNPIPPADAPSAGTFISDMTIPAGAFGAPTVDPPGATEAEMSAWLMTLGLPADADAADLIDTINLAMSYWTMTNQQHAVLLDLLLNRDDVEVAGTGTDRAGRPVIGITADSTRFPGTRRLLLIATDTGRIVAEEVLRTTAEGKLPAGSVISYTLWGLPTT